MALPERSQSTRKGIIAEELVRRALKAKKGPPCDDSVTSTLSGAWVELRGDSEGGRTSEELGGKPKASILASGERAPEGAAFRSPGQT